MDDQLKERIENDFNYHRPSAEAIAKLNDVRAKTRELALLLLKNVPRGRELSTALTKLEEAMFHANAGISREFPVEKAQ